MECKNCENTLVDSSDFCHNCGAKIIRNRLTIRNLMTHFSEQFLNYDNKLLLTFIHLLTKPGLVIKTYLSGTRKKYVNPISYFTIAITIGGLQMFIFAKYFPDAMDISEITAKGQEQLSKNWMNTMQEYQSLLLMAMVPGYALVSRTVFFNYKNYNYTEHLVMYLYILSQITIVTFIPTIILVYFGFTIGNITPYTILFQILYAGYCSKLIFDLSGKGIVLKTLLFLVVFAVYYIVFTILTVIIMILYYGGLKEFVEAMKPN